MGVMLQQEQKFLRYFVHKHMKKRKKEYVCEMNEKILDILHPHPQINPVIFSIPHGTTWFPCDPTLAFYAIASFGAMFHST